MQTKAFFLDRDGVINKEVGDLSRIEDFIMYPFVPEAVRKIHEAEYLAIVITNQPMIAKGFMTEEELSAIHQKMEVGLALQGAKVDAIYYCPHHPERGFKGEVKKLKIACKCRKPAIGMIEKAVKDFNIDLAKSFFIGDTNRDAQTAENAGITFAGVKTGHGEIPVHENLLTAVDFLLKKR